MKKLVVFMIDALCASDIELMKQLPAFSKIINEGSYVASLEPVTPALTYCCHTSILTGTYVDRHGIYNNEDQKRGCKPADTWFGYKKDVKDPTLLDYAREAGLTTCSLFWPVSAGADYTYNWPMIVPYHYQGDRPEDYLGHGNSTNNVMDEYFYKYSRFYKTGEDVSDIVTMSLAQDIIKDHGQPDVMLVKMCDLDSVRHRFGVYSDKAKWQLRKHDLEFESLVETIKRFGDYDNTNFVIIGDHGQTDIVDVLHMNKLLQQAGFIRTDEDGNIVDCDCYAHSTALTCCIELKNPEDLEMAKKVKAFLETLKDDNDIQLTYVYDKKEMIENLHVDGDFDFFIESKRDIAFSERLNVQTIWGTTEPGDHKIGAATHGSSSSRKETTLFIAAGPAVKKGVVLEKRSMVDEAPTMAKMLGLEMKNIDGTSMDELLK